jgi:hypothetical protein
MRSSTNASKRDEMFSLIQKWKDSSLSQKRFCKEHGQNLGTFLYWIKKYRTQTSVERSPTFIPVQFLHQNVQLNIRYPNGVVIEIPSTTPVETLKTLISLI